MKLEILIQKISSQYSKGVQSDDARLTPRHIYSAIKSVRSLLLEQKINKKQFISDWNYITLPCVELVSVPSHQCPCLPTIGCEILRSKQRIPRPISGYGKDGIKSVTSVEGSIQFDPTTWENKKRKSGNKYTSGKPDFFMKGGYMYITVKKGTPKIISVNLLPDDPIEASDFEDFCDNASNCTDCVDCTPYYEKDFPIDESLAKVLIEMVVEQLLSVFNQGREDATNNSLDNVVEETK